MNATAPNTGPLGEQRGVGFVIILTIVTLGIYGLYWQYKTYSELKAHRGDGVNGWVGIVPLAPHRRHVTQPAGLDAATHHFAQVEKIKRLQQVIECVHLKCPEGILIECRNEHNNRSALMRDALEHTGAIDARHLHIQKQQVG